MTEGEEKGMVLSAANWLWGMAKGGFNEQQSISQIVVDALIGMVPLIGDVTAIRDILAVVLRLVNEPERRKERGEWIQLVILLFALLPIAGGAIKGIGRLLVRAGADVAKISEAIADAIKALNRIGEGNAVKWFRSLDLEAFLPFIRAKWLELVERLTNVIDRVLVKMRHLLPDSMLERLAQIKTQLGGMLQVGDRMIPDAIKDLNARLKQVQRHLYEGEWHEIPATFKSSTREAEARIVVSAKGERKWEMSNAHFPQDDEKVYQHVEGWPDMRLVRDEAGRPYAIEGFCGAIRPKRIPGGTKIYRVIDHRKPIASGSWWAYHLPENGRRWREDYAVLNSFSENKLYVEFTVPPEGLWAWEGTVSSQIERSTAVKTAGQYLPGGEIQLFISFRFEKNTYAKGAVDALPYHPTNWTDHMNVNIPDQTVTSQTLGSHEVATKRAPVQAAERLVSKVVRGGQEDQTSHGGVP